MNEFRRDSEMLNWRLDAVHNGLKKFSVPAFSRDFPYISYFIHSVVVIVSYRYIIIYHKSTDFLKIRCASSGIISTNYAVA